MNKALYAVKKEYTVTLPTTLDGAYQSMLNYLKDRPVLPTAYFADNDMIALGAMKALQEMNYRIPEDISMVGFGDLPFSSIASRGLTTIRVPKKEMGQTAVRRMVEIIRDADKTITKTQVCTQFVERKSVSVNVMAVP